MHPNMQLVVVVLPTFWTPRMTMQRWEDSMTTPTPRGCNTSEIAKATCLVRRSWTCNRRENISAKRASLESPSTRRSGMYPICICPTSESVSDRYSSKLYASARTFPVKGTMWCSHKEKTSMSLTMTSSSWSSWKTAPLTKSRTFSS